MHDLAALLFAFLTGLIAGGVAAWLAARAKLAESTAELRQQNAVLQAQLEQARGKGEIESDVAEKIRKQNRDEIGAILKPLHDKIREFQQELNQANKESAEKRGELAAQIKALSQASATMTNETVNLTKALKGDSQMQGAWGEMVLASILEKSGLREGEEYTLQQNHTGEDGQRLRPDAIIHLPNGQKIVIDSKVSLVAFNACVNAQNDGERAAHLDRHLASMRAHVKELAAKEYHQTVGGDLDYVIMFVPIEGALAAALQRDPGLTGEALKYNVTIATPTNLMIVLRTVASIWQVERRNRNADEIAKRAGKIYDKLVGFVADLTQVGSRLDQAKTAYNEAYAKLSTGRGNLVSQVDQLKDLGAKTGSKSLPGSLLEETEALPPPAANEDAA